MAKHDLYVDKSGVKRGYYVYLHKTKKSGKVFYVGKGCKNRAWDEVNRHNKWHSRVEKLNGEWEVELYAEDLTEIEAFRIEEKLVEEYGFFDDDNHQLVNHIPGGEMPASFSIGLDIEKSDQQKTYEENKEFRDLNKNEKLEIAQKLHSELNTIYEDLWELDNQYDYTIEREYDDIDYNPGSVIGALEDAKIAAKEFLNSRISWKEFCLDVEYSYDWHCRDCYQNDEINAERFSPATFSNFEKSRKAIENVFKRIDTPNKEEAEK